MSQTPHDAHLGAVRVLNLQDSMIALETPLAQLPAPTEEQARAVDGVFSTPAPDHNALVDAVSLAAASMLLHDIVADTLAPPREDEEEDPPTAKPKPKPNLDPA